MRGVGSGKLEVNREQTTENRQNDEEMRDER